MSPRFKKSLQIPKENRYYAKDFPDWWRIQKNVIDFVNDPEVRTFIFDKFFNKHQIIPQNQLTLGDEVQTLNDEAN